MKPVWITNGTAKPFYARKVFEIQKAVRSAKVEVCGLGQFVFSMNGKKVSDHELDPGWTNYKKRIQYVSFDVTDRLLPGKNVLGVEVGNGRFIMEKEHYSFHFPDFMPPNSNPYHPFSPFLVLTLKLEILYEDGSREIVHTDDSFRVREHELPCLTSMDRKVQMEVGILKDGIHLSMRILYGNRHRLYRKNWNRPEFWKNSFNPL